MMVTEESPESYEPIKLTTVRSNNENYDNQDKLFLSLPKEVTGTTIPVIYEICT